MKSRHTAAMEALINFINIDLESESGWKTWSRIRGLSAGGPTALSRFLPAIMPLVRGGEDDQRALVSIIIAWIAPGFEYARNLQSEIRNDLSPIVDWEAISQKFYSYEERWVALCEKLNEMNFPRRWRILERDSPTQGFVIPVIPKFSAWNFTKNEREGLYSSIGYLVESGEIENLRNCQRCKKFFEARDRRQNFCRTKCKDDYHKEATGAERVRQSRERRREREGQRGKRLAAQRREKSLARRFIFLMEEASKGNKPSFVKKLGGGSLSPGWNIVQRCIDQIRRGTPAAEILKGLSKEQEGIVTAHINEQG